MRFFGISAFLLLIPTFAFAHRSGVYVIDGNTDAKVTFAVVGRCQEDVEGALRGSLRTLTFSEVAQADPYSFVTGNYVETHVGQQEVYVQTNEQCLEVDDGEHIEATGTTIRTFSLRRITQ
jgi:hypothetical protein